MITPCLQAVATLPDTLIGVARAFAILQQAGVGLEHVVIDGGSTDGTQELLERHTLRHSFCCWHRGIGGGTYAAMNAGLKLARGHYSHVLNADDLLLDPEAYANFLIQSRRRNCALLLASIGYFRRPARRLRAEWIVHGLPSDLGAWHQQLRQGLHYPHPGFIAQTILYRGIGFDEHFSLSADYKLMQTLLLRPELARHVAVYPEPLVAMAQGGATSDWRAILRGRRQLAEINRDLGIKASAWRRYLGKVWLRSVRSSSHLSLPSYYGDQV